METLTFVNRATAKRTAGFMYIGHINDSSKLAKGAKEGYNTFGVYLAPASISGYNVCPKSTAECRKACLFTSGQYILDAARIRQTRILRTKLFFENRPFFMAWLLDELQSRKRLTEKEGKKFAVRLNATSDLSPVQFHKDGKNILELYPDVQFYDYTKVLNRVGLAKKYPNYHLTFSYTGYNWLECETALASGVNVAVVFEEKLPAFFRGIPVVNGDVNDLRFLDPTQVIVGLILKKTKQKYNVNNRQKFVVRVDHPDCTY